MKIARVKTFKAPEKQSGWVAYHLEKPIAKTESNRPARPESSDKKIADSLNRVIDSLKQIIAACKFQYQGMKKGLWQYGLIVGKKP